MKIYTKKGDQGETTLYDGSKISKADLRVECNGTLDELETILGISKNYLDNVMMIEDIIFLQNQLFTVMSNLAILDESKIKHPLKKADVINLESLIDKYSEMLPPLTNFIITGSNKGAGFLHLARTICRKAERKIVLLNQSEIVADYIISYLNRLSDLLYVMAIFFESKSTSVKY